MASKLKIEITKVMSGSANDVFGAIAEGMLLANTGVKKGTLENDFREGGEFSLEWKDGGFGSGRYTKIVPPKLIAFTWKSEGNDCATARDTAVTITLSQEEGICEVTLVHEGLDSGRPFDGHSEGWKEALDKFAKDLKHTARTREFPLRHWWS